MAPQELVERGLRIVPVYCAACGAGLEQVPHASFLCAPCRLQIGALIDRARYCTVCGGEKVSAGEQWLGRTGTSMASVVLCWPHHFAYTREREQARSALYEWVRQALAVARAQLQEEGSEGLRQALCEALEQLTMGADLFSFLLALSDALLRLSASEEQHPEQESSRAQPWGEQE